MQRTCFVTTCCTIALALLGGNASSQETLWTYTPPAGHVDVSPAVADLDGDGNPEIVLGTTAGLVVALDRSGKELWHRQTGASVCIPPTVANVLGDATPHVLAVNRQGRVLCLDGRTGNLVWDTLLPAPPQWGATALAVGDLDGDGSREIVTGTRDGAVVCLRSSGEQAWVYQGNLGNVLCPAIADLNGDGQAEVLVGCEKASLVCLGAGGKELWRLGQAPGASPCVCNLPGSAAPTIVTGIGNTLQALDATGKTLWSCPMHRQIDSAITVADTDGDGKVEIYAVDLSGYMVCVSPDGKLRWTANVEQRVRRSPSIGDVDGDHAMEILVAGYSGAVHVFDAKGHQKARVSLAGPSNATATLAFLGDAGLCAVVPAAGQPVRALHWPGSLRNARIAWPEFRHDASRTGALSLSARKPPVTLSTDFGGMYVGTNFLKAIVHNPERRHLTLRIEIVRNHDAPAVTETITEDEQVERLVPYALPGAEPTDLKLVCVVSEASRVLARQERAARVVPFAREAADSERRIAAVQARLPGLLDPAGIEERAFFVRARLDGLRSRVASAGAASDAERAALRKELTAILREASQLDKLSSMAAAAATEGTTTVVRAANPWSPFVPPSDLANAESRPKELAVGAFGGETESAALDVRNLSNRPRSYRVELEPLSRAGHSVPARQSVTAFEVIEVPTERCDMSADALARLNAASVLGVPAWGARQLWFNVNTSALEPGEWKTNVVLRSLEVTPIEIRVPLTVTVWKTHLPDRHPLRHCGWGYVDSSVLKDQPDAALDDQVSHGTNVFVATVTPKARFDAAGNLVGNVDFAAHDAYVKRHAPHGIVLFCGYQGALEGPANASAEISRKAHLQWLRTWVKHLAQLGVGYDGFALYPVDEPGLEKGRVEEYLQFAKLARQADPKIQMYTDPVSGISPDELRAMLPYVDIWCPNRGLILDKANAEKLAIMLGSKKPVWTYECDDNAKHLSPLGYYRGQSWLAWHHGLSGIGFWSYCTSPDDPWFVPKGRYDYLLVYPGNGVVGSKRWEAVRDGIEDFSMLTMLKHAVQRKANSARPEDLKAAQDILGRQATSVARSCAVDDDETLPSGTDETAIRCRLEERRWAELQRIRSEIARLLDTL